MSTLPQVIDQDFNPGNVDLFDDETNSEIRVEFELISPQQAQNILSANSKNQRKINHKLVIRYAEQMQKGIWAGGNGETIKISGDGELIDGQHRLSAIVMAKKPVKMMIMRGIFADHCVTLDAGKSRTLADVLEIKTGGTVANTARIAGAIKLLLVARSTIARHDSGEKRHALETEKKAHLKLSGTEFIKEFYKFESILHADDELSDIFKRTAIHKVVGAFATTAFWFMYRDINRTIAVKVLKIFEMGAPLDGDMSSPSFIIRKAIVDRRLEKVSFMGWEYLQFLIYAFESEVHHKKMRIGKLANAHSCFINQIYLDRVRKLVNPK